MSKSYKIPFKQVGRGGLIKDVSRDELPDGSDAQLVWTDARNIRFSNGIAEKMLGSIAVLSDCPIAPLQVFSVFSGSQRFYIAAGIQKVYIHNGTSWANITRQTAGSDVNYTGSSGDIWTGGVLNGIPVINNGVDTPQYQATVGTTIKMAGIPNWPTGYKAACIRPFMNFLVAMDITKVSGTRYPNLIKWSDFASFGQIPQSWNEGDPTGSSREAEIGDSDDVVLDCLPLGETNIIYKTNSTWSMSLNAGSEGVFDIRRLFNTHGTMTKRCIAAIPNMHVVLTTDDVIRHNGATSESIISDRNRRWLFSNIDMTNYYKSQVVHNPLFNEVWVIFPQSGSLWCDTALVWNYKQDTWAIRDIPHTSDVATPPMEVTFKPIDDLTGLINELPNTPIDLLGASSLGLFNNISRKLLFVSAQNSEITVPDSSSDTENGEILPWTLIREDLSLGDITTMKTVRAIYPRIVTTGAMKMIDCYVGTSDQVGEPVTWHGPFTFNPNTQFKVDIPFPSGRLISVKFSGQADQHVKINGFDVDFVVNGKW